MNAFDIKAFRIERLFIKKASSEIEYTTGAGKRNVIVNVTSSSIGVKTETGSKPQSISRYGLRKALSYLLRKKTATRRELEKYSHMNSSLMGMLRRILIDIAKIAKTAKGLLRITIKGVRFFFSALDRATLEDLEAVIKNGGKYILCSYYYLRQHVNKHLLKFIKEHDLQLLLDSGEYSAYKARNKGKRVKAIKLQEYADFINTYKPYIFGYFNMDVTNNPEKSKRNFDRLKKLTGISPIPVWHCNVEAWNQSDWESLNKMVEEDHGVIAIGATVHMGLKAGPKYMSKVKDHLFGEIFKRHPLQNFHWLGGSSKILFKYPLFSADSSGYLKGRQKNQLYYFDGEDVSTQINSYLDGKTCLAENIKLLSSIEQLTLESPR